MVNLGSSTPERRSNNLDDLLGLTSTSSPETRMGGLNNIDKRDLLKGNLASLTFLNDATKAELNNLGPIDFQKTDEVLGVIEQAFDIHIKALADTDETIQPVSTPTSTSSNGGGITGNGGSNGGNGGGITGNSNVPQRTNTTAVVAKVGSNNQDFIKLVPLYLKIKGLGSNPEMDAFIKSIEAGGVNSMLASQDNYKHAIKYLKKYVKNLDALDANKKLEISKLTKGVREAESKLSGLTSKGEKHLLKRPNNNVSELAEDEDLIEINDPIINDYLDEQAKINGITDIDQLSRIAREAEIDGPLSLGVDYKDRIDRALTELLEDRGLSSSDFEKEKQEYITQFQLESFEKMEALFYHLQGQIGNGNTFITLDGKGGPIMEFKSSDGLVRKERTLATALKFLEAISKDPVGLGVVAHWGIEGGEKGLSARSPFTWLAIEGGESLNGGEVDGLSETFLALSAIYTLARSVYAPTDSIMKLPFTQRIQGNNSSARNRIKKINLTALDAATDSAGKEAEKTRLIGIHGQDDFDRAVLAKQRVAILDNLILEYEGEVPQNKTLIDKLKKFKKTNVYFKNTGSFSDIRSNNIFYHDLYQLENQTNILGKLKNLDLLTGTPEFIRTLTGRTFFRELSSGETSYELHYQVRSKHKGIKSVGRGIGMDEAKMNDFHEKNKGKPTADIDAVKSEFDGIVKRLNGTTFAGYKDSISLALRNALNTSTDLGFLKDVLKEVGDEMTTLDSLSSEKGYGSMFGEVFERGIFIKGDAALVNMKSNLAIIQGKYKTLLPAIQKNPEKYMSLLESSAPEQGLDILVGSDVKAQAALFDMNGKYDPVFASNYSAKVGKINTAEAVLTKINRTKDATGYANQEAKIKLLEADLATLVSDQETLNKSDLAVARKNTLDKLKGDLSADPDGKVKFDIIKHFILSDDSIKVTKGPVSVGPYIKLADIISIKGVSDSGIKLSFSSASVSGKFIATLDDPAKSITPTGGGSTGPAKGPSFVEKSAQVSVHQFYRLRRNPIKRDNVGIKTDKANYKVMAAKNMDYDKFASIDWKTFKSLPDDASIKAFINAEPDFVAARDGYINKMRSKFPEAHNILHKVPGSVVGGTEYNKLPNFMKILLKSL